MEMSEMKSYKSGFQLEVGEKLDIIPLFIVQEVE
jgi:hypothetical protein